MSTESIQDPALNTTVTTTGEEKVTYTEAQQAHMQGIIDTAVGRSARTLRAEIEAERATAARLTAELAAAKAAKPAVVEPAAAHTEEVERVKASHQAALDAANAQLAERGREVLKAQAEAKAIRTEVAITTAASKVPFVDLSAVIKLTKDQVQLDPDTGRFTVLNEAGQPRLNASFEQMSLDEFYNDFAAKNKYLVRGSVLAGTGSSESSRSTLSANGRFEVTEIFGPKSDGAKASQLKRSDPAEYQRLKAVARAGRIIA